MKMEIEPLTFPGVDPKRPMIIAGPCSAESREQVLKTASELAARGVKIFRHTSNPVSETSPEQHTLW